MPATKLAALDERAPHETSNRAQTYLQRSRESANEILQAVHFLREQRVIMENLSTAGRPNEQEQDLLRAMLVAACAGVDAATKTLIRDALPELADRSHEVQSKLDEFAERYLSEAGAVSPRSLARVLAHEVSPRTAIVEAMTFEMTGGSLQSADQLLSVCSSFGIQDKELTDRVLGIKDAFVARNEIVHEMDMSSGADRWTRRLRSMTPMISMANGVLAVGQEIINRVAEALGGESDEQLSS
jgi:hypothetical protein